MMIKQPNMIFRNLKLSTQLNLLNRTSLQYMQIKITNTLQNKQTIFKMSFNIEKITKYLKAGKYFAHTHYKFLESKNEFSITRG